MNPLIQLKKTTPVFIIVFAIGSFALLPNAQAVPAPERPTPNPPAPGVLNTRDGQSALRFVTTGVANSAFGAFSSSSITTGNFNTSVGAGALDLNTADNNTAVGAAALLLNTTGSENTAVGTSALLNNIVGAANTADGAGALQSNTEGNSNTAIGALALSSDDPGGINTAIGVSALVSNTTGSGNTAIGADAGSNQTTGNDNVYIGAGMLGVAGESGTCYIASIFGQTSSGGSAVFINSSGKLGTSTSSKRFKQDIKPVDNISETLFALKPVSFRYKKEIDPTGISQLGLVAEEVDKVNPDLVVRDKEGKPYSVRYDQVNAMLLNEFLKDHRKVEKLEATVAQQHKDFEAAVAELKEQIQKVSARFELSKPAPRTVVNNR